jgi:hypothetical protein
LEFEKPCKNITNEKPCKNITNENTITNDTHETVKTAIITKVLCFGLAMQYK